jgi:hypothetical protein
MIEKFYEKCTLPKLIQQDKECMNSSIKITCVCQQSPPQGRMVSPNVTDHLNKK